MVEVSAGAKRQCGMCMRLASESEMLHFAELWICAGCKPVYVQRLREGVAPMRPGFRNLSGLTRWVQGFLIVDIALYLLAALFLAVELILRARLEAGEEVEAMVEWSGLAHGGLALFQTTPSTVLLVLWLRWLYLAAFNVRALGASRLRFTPGWAVGWSFIPVANLWMPYLALKEIWQASIDPAQWGRVRLPRLFAWRWALGVMAWPFFGVSIVVEMTATAASVSMASALMALGGNLVEIAGSILSILVVGRVWRAQLDACGGAAAGQGRTATRV